MILSLLFNIFLILWELFYTTVTLPILFLSSKILTFFLVCSVRVVLFALYFFCGISYEIRGTENIPKQPYIVASKHQSPFETFIFILLFKGAVFVLKRELKWIPFIGLQLMALKMIFIDRSSGISSLRKVVKSAKLSIKKKRNIIIFPEGTRVAVGDNRKYQTGIAALYGALSTPVVPIALNTGLFWPNSILSLKRNSGKAIIEILPPIYPGLKKDEFLEVLERAIETKSNQLISDIANQ